MAINKVIFGDKVLINLEADTVSPQTLLKNATAHDKSGEVIEGECTYDSDTSDSDIAVAEMLLGKIAYGRGTRLVGTMPNNGGVVGTITTKTQQYSIPQGYHDGSGKVSIVSDTLLAGNIKSGITILGVQGNYSGASITSESKTVTPTKDGFTVQPSVGKDYLSSVVVNAIPYVEANNAAGGTTVTIG